MVDFEAIDRALAMQLRKFGSNQASFPGLNLISLYRVTDESEKKLVAQCIEKPESIDALQLPIREAIVDLPSVVFGIFINGHFYLSF